MCHVDAENFMVRGDRFGAFLVEVDMCLKMLGVVDMRHSMTDEVEGEAMGAVNRVTAMADMGVSKAGDRINERNSRTIWVLCDFFQRGSS